MRLTSIYNKFEGGVRAGPPECNYKSMLENNTFLLFYTKNFIHNIITELRSSWVTHRVISDRVHRLLVTLSYFRPDRFVQLLSLIPILILLLYYLVSGCLTSLC